jgi:glycosyltransferase involved in cell wall biosynthesis
LLAHTALFEQGVRARVRAGWRPLTSPAAKLEIVNGLGAHRLFAAAWPSRKSRPRDLVSALVVHESPRHFADAPRRMDLTQALQALRSYDYCVFVSERGQKEWTQLGHLDATRSTYIPNCVQEKRVLSVLSSPRVELRKRFGYGAGEVHALCVGRVSPRKGQDLVLASLRAMPPGAPPVHIDFLGDCRSDWARALTARLRGSGLASHVRFLGNVTDVYERMYAADALLVGSRAEAFPLVVLEAMALGMCIVAPDIDGLGEQIVDEQTGLLFTAESVAEFAGYLSRVARDPRLRERLGAAGRARYLERFTRDRQWARWNSALAWMGDDEAS